MSKAEYKELESFDYCEENKIPYVRYKEYPKSIGIFEYDNICFSCYGDSDKMKVINKKCYKIYKKILQEWIEKGYKVGKKGLFGEKLKWSLMTDRGYTFQQWKVENSKEFAIEFMERYKNDK